MAQKEIFYKSAKFEINYEILNIKNEKNIIFLHGWGSNKDVMKVAFKDCLKNFRHIYLDMPGFGKSLNTQILTTKDYANIVELFLEKLNLKKDIIIGHSFGGKVATLLEPKLLVLLSSAGIIEKKPLKVRTKIFLYKLLKPFGSKKLREFFVSRDVKKMDENMYETFKNAVDEDFSSIFANYKKDALIFWGRDDRATSLDSGKKIASLIKKSRFFEFDGDHYFFLKNAKSISQKIEEEYENI